MTEFPARGIMRPKSPCQPGWVSIWRLWGKLRFQVHSCWQNLVPWGCRTDCLAARSHSAPGDHLIPCHRPLHLQAGKSASSSSALTLWLFPSLNSGPGYKGLLWLGQAHPDDLPNLRSTNSILRVKSIMFTFWALHRVCARGGISKFCLPHLSIYNSFFSLIHVWETQINSIQTKLWIPQLLSVTSVFKGISLTKNNFLMHFQGVFLERFEDG